MTPSALGVYRAAGRALFVVGMVLLALDLLDIHPGLRPVLSIVFFATAPGTSVLPHLRPRDPAMAVSLALACSVAATMAVAQAMVWAGSWSPAAAVAVLLAVMSVALVLPARPPLEVPT